MFDIVKDDTLFLTYYNPDEFEKLEWSKDITKVHLERWSDQSNTKITFPSHIKSITFGTHFAIPFNRVVLTPNIEEIIFKEKVPNLILPDYIKSIYFDTMSYFNIEKYKFPKYLKKLNLGGGFNQLLDGVIFPETLKTLIIGNYFNKSLDRVIFPPSLRKLTIGNGFNQPINNVKWVNSIEEVKFGNSFDRPLVQDNLLQFMIRTSFQDKFNLNLVDLPKKLKKIDFGYSFNQPINNIIWPETLEELSFGESFDQTIDNIKWPENLTKMTIKNFEDKNLENLPPSLTHLTIHKLRTPLSNLPPSLEKFILYDTLEEIAGECRIPFGCEKEIIQTKKSRHYSKSNTYGYAFNADNNYGYGNHCACGYC